MSRELETTEIFYRDATPLDVPLLLDFLEPFFDQTIIRRSETELHVLAQHGFVAHLGNADQRIVGFAAIEIYSQKLAEVQSLVVSPEFQRRGIGSELVKRCVARSKREGVLELMAITASEKLFREQGFDYSLPNQRRAIFVQTRETSEDNK